MKSHLKHLLTTAFLILTCLLAPPKAEAALYNVFAFANASSGGGVGVSTISLAAGEAFTVSANPGDLWSAGALPRWSNANGLTGPNLLATGSDDSGHIAGTLIGSNFGILNLSGFSAPFGALVGKIGGTHILLGTSYAGTAPVAGILQLFYWDSNRSDNTEKITVSVQAVPVPEASTWLSGLVATVALAGMMRRPKMA